MTMYMVPRLLFSFNHDENYCSLLNCHYPIFFGTELLVNRAARIKHLNGWWFSKLAIFLSWMTDDKSLRISVTIMLFTQHAWIYFFSKKKRTVSLISFVDKIVCNSWVVVSTTIYIELSTIKMTARLNILGIYII